jgi:acetyl esterase/lipase
MAHSSIIDSNMFYEPEPDPEMEAFNADIEKELSKLPPLHTLPPQVIRDARERGDSIWGKYKMLDEVEERNLKGSTADVPVRVFVPEVVKGVYLHIHGGGFMLGRAYHHDEMMVATAAASQVATVSIDYRLAPENPYPAGPDDCETAAVWLAENALSEFGTDRLVIGGESAGANLSAVTLLRMRDRHDFSGFCGAVLTYGGFDLSMTPSARNWGDRPLILTTPLIRWFHESYAPPDKMTDPDVSPLYADLANMPPALFTIGTLDPLLDDSLFMCARWMTAGNEAELAVYPGGIHAFNAFPLKAAERANRKIADFIRTHLKNA